jgi:hypothetical protein
MRPSCVPRGRQGRRVRLVRRDTGFLGLPDIALARPKSSTFTVPVGADLDVGRLEIAMDDALGVCARQRLSDLSGDIQRPGRSQRLRFDRGAEFADPCRRG